VLQVESHVRRRGGDETAAVTVAVQRTASR
jgi:hypothetical protein